MMLSYPNHEYGVGIHLYLLLYSLIEFLKFHLRDLLHSLS